MCDAFCYDWGGEGGVERDILVYHSPVSWVLQWWHGIEKGSFQGKRKF